MSTISFKGSTVHTSGTLPQQGKTLPDFTLVKGDLSEVSLSSFGQKKKILNIFPSLDTGVCAASVKKFHDQLKGRDDIVLLNISLDLPFAQSRFCQSEALKQLVTLSAFRSTFPKDYGVLMVDGPLSGLCSRGVIVADQNNKIIYVEQVPEITKEPDYEKALEALDSIP